MSIIRKKIIFIPLCVLTITVGALLAFSSPTLRAITVKNIASNPSLSTDIANKGYLDSVLLWLQNGSTIYTIVTGTVGIGTTNPKSKLDIIGGGISIDGIAQRGKWHSRVPSNNSIGTVDTIYTGNVPSSHNLTIASDGSPIMAYPADLSTALKVIKCGNLSCSANNTITTVNTTNDGGQYPSIAIGTDGLPVISHYGPAGPNGFKIAKCTTATCSTATITTLEVEGNLGRNTSIAIGTDGLPVAVYFNNWGNLKIAKCSNTSCTAATITQLDGGNVLSNASIAVRTDGLPIISYEAADALKIVRCTNVSCSTFSITTADTLDSGWSGGTAITIGSDTFPMVAYSRGTSQVAFLKCGNTTCDSGNTTSSIASETNENISLALDERGMPRVIYNLTTGILKMISCGTVACSANNTSVTLDTSMFKALSLTYGADGLPLMTYIDVSGATYYIAVAKCGSPTCDTYWTQR
ncbi:MAG: hypothetical protein HYW78_03610 [Parcubacteria group bacterium]|nr:hypothetical protein [Parcubacteria group bacterium]